VRSKRFKFHNSGKVTGIKELEKTDKYSIKYLHFNSTYLSKYISLELITNSNKKMSMTEF